MYSCLKNVINLIFSLCVCVSFPVLSCPVLSIPLIHFHSNFDLASISTLAHSNLSLPTKNKLLAAKPQTLLHCLLLRLLATQTQSYPKRKPKTHEPKRKCKLANAILKKATRIYMKPKNSLKTKNSLKNLTGKNLNIKPR